MFYWKKKTRNHIWKGVRFLLYAPDFFEGAAKFRARERGRQRVLTDADFFLCVVDVHFAVRHRADDDGDRLVGYDEVSRFDEFRRAEGRGQFPAANW